MPKKPIQTSLDFFLVTLSRFRNKFEVFFQGVRLVRHQHHFIRLFDSDGVNLPHPEKRFHRSKKKIRTYCCVAT
jgi:hypothetical protein